MFTLFVMQNECDESWETLERYLKKEFPSNDVRGTFGYEYALHGINYYSEAKGETPSFGVFIIDINMDDGDPVTLIKSIKNSPVLGKIPVVIFSDNNNDAYKKLCLNAGAEREFRRGDLKKLADYIKTVMIKTR
jgi:CheY-like chemotaxis protein